jgi:hypothetical protein
VQLNRALVKLKPRLILLQRSRHLAVSQEIIATSTSAVRALSSLNLAVATLDDIPLDCSSPAAALRLPNPVRVILVLRRLPELPLGVVDGRNSSAVAGLRVLLEVGVELLTSALATLELHIPGASALAGVVTGGLVEIGGASRLARACLTARLSIRRGRSLARVDVFC